MRLQDLREQLEKAEREMTEVKKVAEAELELQAVIQLAAVGSSVTLACQITSFAAEMVGRQGPNLEASAVEALNDQIIQHFAEHMPAAAAGAPQKPQQAAPAAGGPQGAAAAATAPPLLLRGRRGIAADAADAVVAAASEVSGPSSPGTTSLDGAAAAFLPPARREDERAPKNEAAAEARRGVAVASGAAAEVGSMDSSCDEVRALLCESFFVLFCVGVGSIVIFLSVSDSKGTREGPGGVEERGRFLLMGGATRSVARRALASLRKKNIVE